MVEYNASFNNQHTCDSFKTQVVNTKKSIILNKFEKYTM